VEVHSAKSIRARFDSMTPSSLIFRSCAQKRLPPYVPLNHTDFVPFLVTNLWLWSDKDTCATLLLTKGVHPKIVQEMLGHSSITIALDLHSHVLPDMQKQAVRAMEDILDG
jgi:integrase